jgi:hypothetical protein
MRPPLTFFQHISTFLFNGISPRSQPLMARQSYAHELQHAMSYPVAMAMLEGAVVSVLAEITFDVTDTAFAAIVAAPMFANLTSFFWARASRGKRKVPMLVALQLGILAIVATIAMLPTDGFGPHLLPWLVIAGRSMNAGIVTIRSTVWRLNYPSHVRGQITGNLVRINMLIMIAPPLIGFATLDIWPNAFRVFYPASLLFGVFGAYTYSRIRLRHERELLLHENKIKETYLPTAVFQPTSGDGIEVDDDFANASQAGNLAENEKQSATVWTVLKTDRLFRQYLIWQFIAGMSNMMGETVIYKVIVEFLSEYETKNLISILLTHSIPILLAVITLSMWARLLDRVHIVHFRSRQSVFWITNQSLNWIGTTFFILPVLFVARLSQGFTRGGGMLAWHVGHNDFSHKHHSALYMGIHVTLTGVRGFIAPFLGVWLYKGWTSQSIGGIQLPAFDGIGYHVFGVTTTLAIIASIGFFLLKQKIKNQQF